MAVLDDFVVSSTFRVLVPACADRVWSALTCPVQTGRFLHSLAVRSSWQPGATVTFWLDERVTASGQVLCAQRPRQLSYSVDDDSGTATYVTWQLRAVPDGCVVRLRVDETHGDATSEDELEDVWLPVVERLRAVLQDA